MKYIIREVQEVKQIPKKTGIGTFTVSKVMDERGETFEVLGMSVKVGDVLDGTIQETQWGKQLQQERKFPQDKRDKLSARQTALNCSTALASVMIEHRSKDLTAKDVVKGAEFFEKWLMREEEKIVEIHGTDEPPFP